MGIWRNQLTTQQQDDVDVLEYDFDQIISDLVMKYTSEAVRRRAELALNKVIAAGLSTDVQNNLVAQLTAAVDAEVAAASAAKAQQLKDATPTPVTPAPVTPA